jgi:hypothetical protein
VDKWQFFGILRRLDFKYSSIWREMFFRFHFILCWRQSLNNSLHFINSMCTYYCFDYFLFHTFTCAMKAPQPPFQIIILQVGDYSAKSPGIFIWAMAIPYILSLVSLLKWHFMPQVLFNLIFNQWNLTIHYITNW